MSNMWLWQWIQNAFTYLWDISYNGVNRMYEHGLYIASHLPEIFQNFANWLSETLSDAWQRITSLFL